MNDRTGMSYEELLTIQQQQLALWGERVQSHIISDVAHYVVATNRPANDASEKHRVYRGQDIIELIRTWPERNKAIYPDVLIEVAPTAADLI